MLDARAATLAGTRGRPNEDAFAVLPTLLVVADGATSPASLGDGCIHGPAWYARHLVAAVVAAHSADPDAAPSDLTRIGDHAHDRFAFRHLRCRTPRDPVGDCCHPLFDTSGLGRWLVLGDCTLLHDNGTELLVVTDNRLSNSSLAEREAIKVPGGASDPSEHLRRVDALVLAQRNHRNRPGGFWVASSNPEAAYHAYVGNLQHDASSTVNRAALLTDGASSVVDTYAFATWAEVMKVMEAEGPGSLLKIARSIELDDQYADSFPRIKFSDDATALFATWRPKHG